MELGERRELTNGFGNSLSRAFELALTPAIFAGIGWLIDGRLGTRPLFTIVLFLVVVSYLIWKMFKGYDADMREQEARLLGRLQPDRDGRRKT
jgi:F0F1-type ATP synthase assembly protein I